MSEENEELDMNETRRLIGPNSYDDNWQLVNYTSELRDRNGNFYAFVDFNEHGIGEIKYCPHCLAYGFKHKLGPKIKKKGEPPAPDDDQFMSCYECGNTFPVYETFTESKIKDSVETTDNPFENESTFLSADSRATQRRKGKKPRSKHLKTEEHEDPEIQAEINKGNTVNFVYDSSNHR
jgi:hypothetical protein